MANMPTVQQDIKTIEPVLRDDSLQRDELIDTIQQHGLDHDGLQPNFWAPAPQTLPTLVQPVHSTVAIEPLIEEQEALAVPSVGTAPAPRSLLPLSSRKQPPSKRKGPVFVGCMVCLLLAFGITMTQVSCVDVCGEYGYCTGFSCRCHHPYTGEYCDAWPNGTSIHSG